MKITFLSGNFALYYRKPIVWMNMTNLLHEICIWNTKVCTAFQLQLNGEKSIQSNCNIDKIKIVTIIGVWRREKKKTGTRLKRKTYYQRKSVRTIACQLNSFFLGVLCELCDKLCAMSLTMIWHPTQLNRFDFNVIWFDRTSCCFTRQLKCKNYIYFFAPSQSILNRMLRNATRHVLPLIETFYDKRFDFRHFNGHTYVYKQKQKWSQTRVVSENFKRISLAITCQKRRASFGWKSFFPGGISCLKH